MGKKSGAPRDPDRHLTIRGGRYHYKRRVPANVADIDSRAPHIRISLKTPDLAVARLKRDAYEQADDQYWAGLLSGDEATRGLKKYQAAVKRAEALGFAYRSATDIATYDSSQELARRMLSVMDERTLLASSQAVMGLHKAPLVTVSIAFELYCDEIMRHELVSKSKSQRDSWKKVKRRAVENFKEQIGDKPLEEITRDDALAFYRFWLGRVAPETGRPTHSASSGNRDLGNMRRLYGDYFAHLGQRDRQNPFDGLHFSEKNKRSRPPFAIEWVRDKILRLGAMRSLNDDARGIILAMIETGARPSELCNLDSRTIILDHEVPHIVIQPRADPDDPREIKTASSVRKIPLVGVSLAWFQKHPEGFPRYWNKELTLSNTLNKSFKAADLLPTPQHSVYSLRHTFEDRMKVGGVDEELRRMLMGHAIDRPKYGEGGSLLWRRQVLESIALPFDSDVV